MHRSFVSNSRNFLRYSSLNFLVVGSDIWIFNFPEKYLAARVGPFSAAYFPIAALSLGVYRLYLPRLAVDGAVVAVMAFFTNAFITSSSLLDKDGTLVGSDTKDKLEGELLFFVLLCKKYVIQQRHHAINRKKLTVFNFTVPPATIKP